MLNSQRLKVLKKFLVVSVKETRHRDMSQERRFFLALLIPVFWVKTQMYVITPL